MCVRAGGALSYAKFKGTGEQEQSAQEGVNSEDIPACMRSIRQSGISGRILDERQDTSTKELQRAPVK